MCMDTVSELGRKSICQLPCEGDTDQICGDVNKFSVYSLHNVTYYWTISLTGLTIIHLLRYQNIKSSYHLYSMQTVIINYVSLIV